MSTHIMLSLDVEKDAPDEKRHKFYEMMATNRWRKLSGVSTTWGATYKPGFELSVVSTDAQGEILRLAAEADVIIEAWMQVGNGEPRYFKSEPRKSIFDDDDLLKELWNWAKQEK